MTPPMPTLETFDAYGPDGRSLRIEFWFCEWGGLRAAVAKRFRRSPEDNRDWQLFIFDVKRADAEYWRSVRQFLRCAGGVSLRPGYKTLRRGHCESKQRDWEHSLDPKVARWAEQELRRASNELSCVDNYRVARMGNTAQMRRYRRQQSHGCCGSYDAVHIGPDGRRYLLGFNYGH